ncbi:hypothetical protein Q0590_33805 [Rhodocytophaga aerolata]|uniref:Lipocalin-like domain-containing protein n=1 Tax=Rhodocytophaga aerolata TaxID=455078 RepID=A0ABT8RIV6_9BACT|nr:hypothetical protein [Rhodocytophaga aerolata]MDO1451299.1 hypothetical protein [Rhodocytophaga aerolata]
MRPILIVLCFVILPMISLAQKKSTAEIITGKWKIKHNLPAIDNNAFDELDSLDRKAELMQEEDKQATFNNGQFILGNGRKKGKYMFKGSRIYLDDVEYRTTYYSDDKFILLRKASPNVVLSYTFERM